jgi:subtilisin family serine protease
MWVAALLSVLAASSFPSEGADREANVLLVKLDVHAEAKDQRHSAQQIIASWAASKSFKLSLRRPSVLGWYLVDVADDDVEAAVEALRGEPQVVAVQPVYRDHALATVPNDEFVDQLWGFGAIDVFEAWDTTIGSSTQRIGIVDSGLTRDHVDFSGRDVGGFDFVADGDRSADGGGRDPDYSDEGGDSSFHGSHVAGTIGARADDGVGVPGLNWRAGLMSVRALGVDGAGSQVDIYEGMLWLAGFHVDGVPDIGADRVSVVNLSLGSLAACNEFQRDTTAAAISAGVVIVAAAGNEGNDQPTGAPANCPGVIAVGAMGGDFAMAHYSNFDDRVDIMAPGGSLVGNPEEDVLSVNGESNSGWVALAGTSMATPHVTGVVSLMQAANPQLSPAQIASLLASSARFTCNNCGNKPFLDAVSAVAAASTTAGEQPSACADNAVVVDDVCTCLPGFVVNVAQDGCEPSSDDNDGCPANSSPSGDDCFCDNGFGPNEQRDACVPVDDNNNNPAEPTDSDDRDDDDNEDEDDDDDRNGRRQSRLASCDHSGSSPLWVGLALLPLLLRRCVVRQCARTLSVAAPTG